MFKRFFIISLIFIFSTVCVSAETYTNEQLDYLISQEYHYQEQAHNMAESARALGYPEDSDIVQLAKQHWNNSQNNIELYQGMYVTTPDISAMTPSELLIYMCEVKGIDSALPLAISALETGNWTSSAFRNKNNWGGMRNSKGNMSFSSRESGCEAFVNLIIKYYNRGLNTPEKMEKIYCPDGSGWAKKVRSLMS